MRGGDTFSDAHSATTGINESQYRSPPMMVLSSSSDISSSKGTDFFILRSTSL